MYPSDRAPCDRTKVSQANARRQPRDQVRCILDFKGERRKCQTLLTSEFFGVLVALHFDQRAPARTVPFYYHRIVHFDDDGRKLVCYAEAGPEQGSDKLY